jgi:hypothetical protein
MVTCNVGLDPDNDCAGEARGILILNDSPGLSSEREAHTNKLANA